jgi:hypothetical protein
MGRQTPEPGFQSLQTGPRRELKDKGIFGSLQRGIPSRQEAEEAEAPRLFSYQMPMLVS